MRCFLVVVLSGAVFAVRALGAEDRIDDLRIAAGYGPDRFHASGTMSNLGVLFESSESNHAVRDERFALCYVRSLGPITRHGGWILGAEFSENIAEGRSDAVTDLEQTTRLRALMLDVVAGYAVPLGVPSIHLEATPFAGTGYAHTRYGFTAANGDTYATTSQPAIFEYGARLGVVASAPGGWQIGVDLRYSQEKSSVSSVVGRDSFNRPTAITEEFRFVGLGALVSLGHRF